MLSETARDALIGVALAIVAGLILTALMIISAARDAATESPPLTPPVYRADPSPPIPATLPDGEPVIRHETKCYFPPEPAPAEEAKP